MKQLKIYVTLFVLILLSYQQANGQMRKKLNMGYSQPQSEGIMPQSRAPIPYKASQRVPKTQKSGVVERVASERYRFSDGWEMIEAYKTTGKPLFDVNFNTSDWYNATVPGTVLTTLVNQGVYADPYFGLNNLAIPDTLARMDWWYRIEFDLPKDQLKKKSWITFDGINYRAEIWLNSELLGTINGAFLQKKFDVTQILRTNQKNVLAVKIIPPEVPGWSMEKSVKGGPLRNGGAMDLMGATFISSLGWDWMPTIRDRDIGIWQDVYLSFTNEVTIDYTQVITDLPLPDTSAADLTIKAELTNHSNQSQKITLTGIIDGGINVKQEVEMKPLENKIVTLSPDKFQQLHIKNPRLWWPNGYGDPNLYNLELNVSNDRGEMSHQRFVRFGIRELSYELTLDAPQKKEWRVEYNPLKAVTAEEPFIDFKNRRAVYPKPLDLVTLRDRVWIPSLKKNFVRAAFQEVKDESLSPFLIFKVNGKRIFIRGGNWGMDEAMKRVSREFLEPAFRLHRDANYNLIRNWTGESTEEVFYDLADEYGLLVWNDFWLSKDFYDIDVFDSRLFLDNARNVVKRFRNHPSIILWCARNEGVPLDILRDGCAQIVMEEDGTRYYVPTSRNISTVKSGPWKYFADLSGYAATVAGFKTEVGIPSLPTGETMRAMMADEDVWPPQDNDVWAYHDWHSMGAWDRKPYKDGIDTQYGESDNIDDFAKKAQMVNYESHRALYEAWNSKMWDNATGVMFWMSHPAWPSTTWQLYSSDYEILGSYYGTQKACEFVHVQMTPDSNKIQAVNITSSPYNNSNIILKIYAPDGRLLSTQSSKLNVKENAVTDATLRLSDPSQTPVFLAILELTDNKGRLLSENRYWISRSKPQRNFLVFNDLPKVKLGGVVKKQVIDGKEQMIITIKNPSKSFAVGVKFNIRDAQTNERILPAYFSDGYFTMLPKESKKIYLDLPPIKGNKNAIITVEGYNVDRQQIDKTFTLKGK